MAPDSMVLFHFADAVVGSLVVQFHPNTLSIWDLDVHGVSTTRWLPVCGVLPASYCQGYAHCARPVAKMLARQCSRASADHRPHGDKNFCGGMGGSSSLYVGRLTGGGGGGRVGRLTGASFGRGGRLTGRNSGRSVVTSSLPVLYDTAPGFNDTVRIGA